MECLLVALDKLGIQHVGIGETLCRALTNMFLRAADDQVKVA